ncbi:MAG: hypothetical protein AAB585_01485 [Patescibacteria group bacterium]
MTTLEKSPAVKLADKILTGLKAVKASGALDRKTWLALEKDILLLKLALIDSAARSKRERILEFIAARGQVKSLEIFNNFTETSRRQLKRDLNKLVSSGTVVKKVVNNNQTVYSLGDTPDNQGF